MINSAWLLIILPAVFMAGYCWGYVNGLWEVLCNKQKKEEINPTEIGRISGHSDKFFIKAGANRVYKEDLERYLQAN